MLRLSDRTERFNKELLADALPEPHDAAVMSVQCEVATERMDYLTRGEEAWGERGANLTTREGANRAVRETQITDEPLLELSGGIGIQVAIATTRTSRDLDPEAIGEAQHVVLDGEEQIALINAVAQLERLRVGIKLPLIPRRLSLKICHLGAGLSMRWEAFETLRGAEFDSHPVPFLGGVMIAAPGALQSHTVGASISQNEGV